MSMERYLPSEEEKENAAIIIRKLLEFKDGYHWSAQVLANIVDRCLPGVLNMYAGILSDTDFGLAKIADAKIPRIAVDILQLDLLEDESLRRLLLEKLHEKDPDNEIFTKKPGRDTKRYRNESDLFASEKISVEEIMKYPWKPGSMNSIRFVRAFGLPDIFAGLHGLSPQSPFEDVEGPIKLHPLRDFQENIRDQILALVNTETGNRNRGIVRLPPGSGKTRIVIDALIKYWKNRTVGKVKFILWIAQTEELCEQAFQSFKQAWSVEGGTEQKLRLFRMWGAQRILPNLDQEGIIVAGIDKLFSGIRINDEMSEFQTGLESLAGYIGIIIVDEAHSSITKKYNTVFNTLGIKFPSSNGQEIPLIGLTATPFRGYDQDDTKYLLEKYNSNILYPRAKGFDPAVWSNWKLLKRELIDRRILSKPIHRIITTNRNFDVDYHDFFESAHGMMRLLDEISSDFERNKIIFNTLLDLSKEKKSIIYFAPSVTNANIMAALLRDRGVQSGVVISGTSSGIRQMYIKKFKEQKIRILCNFGVLTTGFDSPLIDAVMIARPTKSPNLYEQMIGRGMRGPEFGGTEECLILDLFDNIYIHKLGRKYRFHDKSEDFWNSMEFDS